MNIESGIIMGLASDGGANERIQAGIKPIPLIVLIVKDYRLAHVFHFKKIDFERRILEVMDSQPVFRPRLYRTISLNPHTLTLSRTLLGIAFLNSTKHDQKTTSGRGFLVGSDINTQNSKPGFEAVLVDDPQIDKLQCTIEVCANKRGFVEIVNYGRPLVLPTGLRISRDKKFEAAMPLIFLAGDTHVQVFDTFEQPPLDTFLCELENSQSPFGSSPTNQRNRKTAPSSETLTVWFEAIGRLNRSVAMSQSFFHEAARAIFNPGGLDGSFILQKMDNSWRIAGSHLPYPDSGIHFRMDLVERVVQTRKTVFHNLNRRENGLDLQNLQSCVVCPVVEQDKDVTTVVYGFRRQHRTNGRLGIRPLEAQFVQLVADTMGAAQARMESEAQVAQSRILLEQAFAPEVARMLETNREVLEGCDREVSVLFADLRQFSTISERIGAQATYELLTDVMDCFCHIVTENDGVVIDFFGDGLAAFWNAPLNQANHPELACKAGLAIADSMRELNQIWAHQIGQNLKVGVGIHSGMARVGNSGSSRRLKYGPQGTTVNIASRIETSTKRIGVPVLISGATAAQVDNSFLTRRICTTQLNGINSLTELYQLQDLKESKLYNDRYQKYAKALSCYESGQLTRAIESLAALQLDNNCDSVVEYLLRQALTEHERLMKGGRLVRNPNDVLAHTAFTELKPTPDKIEREANSPPLTQKSATKET